MGEASTWYQVRWQHERVEITVIEVTRFTEHTLFHKSGPFERRVPRETNLSKCFITSSAAKGYAIYMASEFVDTANRRLADRRAQLRTLVSWWPEEKGDG